jgi:RNA polymerase sigma-70 factor (ECF subfamily)
MAPGLRQLSNVTQANGRMPHDDNSLMMLARNGSEDAFMELVSRYKNPMVGYIYRLTGHYETAVDLAQDLFVKVFQNVHRYDPGLKFSTWIYKIATNLAIDEIRRRKRRPVADLPPDATRLSDSHPSDHDPYFVPRANPEQQVLDGEVQRHLFAALQALDPENRQLFLLKEVEQMPLEEISRLTGLKVGTLKSRLFRIRGELKERLSAYLHRGMPV